MTMTEVGDVVTGEGYAVGNIDAMGEGPGFRKLRSQLGVTAFGVNVLVLPAGFEARPHQHEQQEELYFVHRGSVTITFGDGTTHLLGEGAAARVDASTMRQLTGGPDGEAYVLVTGGKDGYVGRDGLLAGTAE